MLCLLFTVQPWKSNSTVVVQCNPVVVTTSTTPAPPTTTALSTSSPSTTTEETLIFINNGEENVIDETVDYYDVEVEEVNGELDNIDGGVDKYDPQLEGGQSLSDRFMFKYDSPYADNDDAHDAGKDSNKEINIVENNKDDAGIFDEKKDSVYDDANRISKPNQPGVVVRERQQWRV